MMRKAILVFGVMALLLQVCFVPAVSAKMYTWVDRNGVTRRTYYPPPPDQVKKENQGQQAPVYQKKADNQVELYVTSWCPYCTQALEYFRSQGVQVKVYDIEKDRNAAARKENMDGDGGVPFAVVNGQYISGYSPEEYSRALR